MHSILQLLSVFLGCSVLLASCGGPEQGDEAQKETETAVSVEAQVVQTQTHPQLISYSANVEAWEVAYISGPSGVRISEIRVDEGDRVRKGQVLAVMNATQLNQARTQMELAKREVERLDTLVKIGSVSGQRFDQAQTEYENALNNYRNQAQNTQLVATFDGVITGKHFSEGEIFAPSADAPAILTMMQIAPVKVFVNISEGYYNQVKEGLQAVIQTDVYPGEEFIGEVYRKSPTIDRSSRTFQAEISIANKEGKLRPGMFARVRLNLGELEGVYIPATAVVNQPGTNNQFVFLKEGERVKRVPIETGNRYRDQIRILNGLEAGQTIITEGIGKLNEGTLVRVVGSR